MVVLRSLSLGEIKSRFGEHGHPHQLPTSFYQEDTCGGFFEGD